MKITDYTNVVKSKNERQATLEEIKIPLLHSFSKLTFVFMDDNLELMRNGEPSVSGEVLTMMLELVLLELSAFDDEELNNSFTQTTQMMGNSFNVEVNEFTVKTFYQISSLLTHHAFPEESDVLISPLSRNLMNLSAYFQIYCWKILCDSIDDTTLKIKNKEDWFNSLFTLLGALCVTYMDGGVEDPLSIFINDVESSNNVVPLTIN